MHPVLEFESGDELRYQQVEADLNRAYQSLLVDLDDSSWRIRRLAVDRLCKLKNHPQLVDDLIHKLSQRSQTAMRNAAAMVLTQIGVLAVGKITAQFARADADQKKFLVEILGAIGGSSVENTLIEASNDADVNVSAAAIESLGSIASPEAARALHQRLHSPHLLVQVAVLESLFRIKSAPSLHLLWPFLENPLTQKGAFRLLGLLQGRACLNRICLALSQTNSRSSALLALGQMNRNALLEIEFTSLGNSIRVHEDAIDFVKAMLRSDEAQLQAGALVLAQALEDPSLALDVCRTADRFEVGALEVLLSFGTDGARQLLANSQALIEVPNAAKTVAGDCIASASDLTLVEDLKNVLAIGDDELVHMALVGLGRSKSRMALEPLARALENADTVQGAARALTNLGRTFRDDVLAVLHSELKKNMHPSLLNATFELADTSLLEASLVHSQSTVRACGAAHAREISLEALHNALFDESPVVRRSAGKQVLRMSAIEAAGLIEKLLHDADSSVRTTGCDAAVTFRALASIPTLEALTKNSEPGVVIAAMSALAELDGLNQTLAATLAQHPDVAVAKTALVLGAPHEKIIALAEQLVRNRSWELRAAAADVIGLCSTRPALAFVEEALLVEKHEVAHAHLTKARLMILGRT
jgi:HEAT repeat protein